MSIEPSDAGQCPDSAAADGELIDAARREVEALGTGAPAGGTLESVTLDSPAGRSAFPAPSPESFAGYQILKELHRGGQGVVYQALQKSTKRKVAIKVMKEGPFASAGDRARFEREVQILGQLSHPNIVAIHDSGVTADTGVGRYHYFVMDYISGQPLDVYMASGGRSIADTLKLFARVCEAVNAAHLRGIIHRDLKPGNIRVDANGEPHVLDFGLAKVASGAGEASLMTITGQFVGSLPWASPEQAEGVPTKIDIRTDVYSLGVILYQMLTSKFPYEVIGNMRDVLDRIMKAEPTRPSTIRKQINDEVETIVLKCLSKERDRRYQTAGELGRDIGHYLKGEPIEAKRDSALYVLKKQMRRYKLPVAVAAAFVLLLAAFGVAMSVTAARNAELAARERAAKSDALAERSRADERAAEALTARDQAELDAYVADITAAESALRLNAGPEARVRLDAAPPRLRNWEWRHLSARAERSLMVLAGHTAAVTSVAFSPDGRRALTGSSDNTARLWDSNTGKELAVLRGHTGHVSLVAFSQNGERVLTESSDGTARLWDGHTGAELGVLRGHSQGAMCVGLSPDGTRVLTGYWDSTARLCDVHTDAELGVLRGPPSPVFCVAFSPDGKRVLTGHYDSTALLWDAGTVTAVRVLRGHGGIVRSGAFSPDGKRVLTGSDDNSARVWDADTGAEVAVLRGHTDQIASVTFSPDGMRIATGAGDGSARIWDAATGSELTTLRGHAAYVNSVAFSPDGTRVLTGSEDSTARLWDAYTGHEPAVLSGHTGQVSSVAFSPDGTRVLSGSRDGSARLWDALTGAELCVLRGHERKVTSLAFSPDGTRVLTGSEDHTARLWEADTGAEVAVLRRHEQSVFSVAFGPDGERVATACLETAYVSDAHTGAELAVLRGHESLVNCVAFSPDGTRLLTGSDDGTARMWDAQTGVEVAVLRGHEGSVLSVAFSRDGSRMLTASETVGLWDVHTATQLATLRGPTRGVWSVTFSPDGTRVLAGCRDNTARIWDALTGAEVAVLHGHTRWVWPVAFSPDGIRVATGSWDGTVRLWDSVPYVARFAERQAARAAKAQARPIVDGLRTELGDWSKVAAAVRADGFLEPLPRQQALNIVLQEAARVRDRAAQLVSELTNKLILTQRLIEQLSNDDTIPADVRELALTHARSMGDDPQRLFAPIAEIVLRSPQASADRYALALRATEVAVAQAPNDGYLLTLLGLAQYRTGDHAAALATLMRSDQLNRRPEAPHNQNRPPAASKPADGESLRAGNLPTTDDTGFPIDVAFIAMSLQQLGRHDEALAALERLHALASQEFWHHDAVDGEDNVDDVRTVVQEAEALILSQATTRPDRQDGSTGARESQHVDAPGR
jgi:WD40 repeat protein/tetratricopeptide (TPR) repeat protein